MFWSLINTKIDKKKSCIANWQQICMKYLQKSTGLVVIWYF